MISGILFIVLVFAAVFLLAATLVVPAFGDRGRARRMMRRRLQQIDSDGEEEELVSLVRQKFLRELPPFERRLEQLPWMEPLGRLIEQSGHGILAHRLVLVAIGAALLGGAIGWGLARLWIVTIALALLFGALPFLKILKDRQARFAQFDEQLPDAMDVMKRALRAGHPFSACIKLVADDMVDPIASEFRQTFADMSYGNDVRRAMLGLLVRVPSITLMGVVTAVLVQRETGGNLAEIFERISSVVRGRFRFQRRVRTLSAEGRLSAWILTLVPIVLFAVIWVTTPDYLPVLLDDNLGQRLLIGSGVVAVLGILWMRKIIQIEA